MNLALLCLSLSMAATIIVSNYLVQFPVNYLNLNQILILMISAIFLSIGYIFAVATIQIALVSTTSTFRYSVIIWGIVYGYLIFNEIPKLNTFIGGLMIIISGLIIILREKHLGKID